MMKNWAMLVVTMVVGGCGGADFVASAVDVIDAPVKDGAGGEDTNKSCRRVIFGENTGGVVCNSLEPPILYLCQPAAVPVDAKCMQPDRAEPRFWCCAD